LSSIIDLRINGEEFKIDVTLEGFTAGELNGVERNTGMTWQEWLEKLADPKISSLAWTALAWLAVRRSGSFVTFDEFEDSIKVMELLESVDNEEAQTAAKVARRSKSTT
jgi:hypothetical protein